MDELEESVGRTDAEVRFETIYMCIRERISLLDYEPGTRLSEEYLAQEFNVSRTPIRRVLGRLEAEGLVEIRHGAGTFITEVTWEDLYAVYKLRMELVRLVDVLAPQAPTPDLLADMRRLQQQCREVANAQCPRRRFAEINMAMFERLMQLVGNAYLQEILERLFYRTARMWPYLMDDASVLAEAVTFADEIGDTVRLLASGNIDSVGHLRRCHIAMALQRLLNMYPQPEINPNH